MIHMRGVEKSYPVGAGRTWVLRRIDLDLREGEFITIMGPSGAGKSTLMAILGMLDSAWEGEYQFLEYTVHKMKPQQRVELHKRFPGKEPLAISVNLSVRQLQSDSIVSDVRCALETSGLPPASLVLEITESVMMSDTDFAVQRLSDLKALGVRLAMDDFGTGYSSLSYLSRLPVDIIKMDRSFLGGGIDDNGLAAAIMAIGERLGLEVVAEGIERRDQIDSLQSLGFGLGQGFLFGRPMPQGPLDDYLSNHGESISARFDSDAA